MVRRFCNSVNHENGADRFATSAGFDGWLVSEGRHPTHPTPTDLATIIEFREGLHDITVANGERLSAPGAWEVVAEAVSAIVFVAAAADHGIRLIPEAPSPTGVFLGELALICMRAESDGSLTRLKSCINCEWTVYDSSKNRGSRWCSMGACGGRHNARTYRRRQREGIDNPR